MTSYETPTPQPPRGGGAAAAPTDLDQDTRDQVAKLMKFLSLIEANLLTFDRIDEDLLTKDSNSPPSHNHSLNLLSRHPLNRHL